MTNHTFTRGIAPVSERPESVRKPVSSGHYSIVNGVERVSEHPPVVIAEKKISSGNIPAVLDPSLVHKRTMLGLSAVTQTEMATVTPEPAPDTLKVPMRFSKPPSARKPTVLGLDIGEELAQLQQQRAAELAKAKELDDFIEGIDMEPFALKPRNGEVGWFVRSAFGSLELTGGTASVISVGRLHLSVQESLPPSFRGNVIASVRGRVNDVVTKLSQILWTKGDDPKSFTPDRRERIARIAERVAATLPEEVKAIVDPSTVSEAYLAAACRRAIDILEGKNGLLIGGFFALFTQGWVPVGVLDDGSFLVITK